MQCPLHRQILPFSAPRNCEVLNGLTSRLLSTSKLLSFSRNWAYVPHLRRKAGLSSRPMLPQSCTQRPELCVLHARLPSQRFQPMHRHVGVIGTPKASGISPDTCRGLLRFPTFEPAKIGAGLPIGLRLMLQKLPFELRMGALGAWEAESLFRAASQLCITILALHAFLLHR